MTKRRAAFLIAKIVFAAVVLGWLFHKVDIARVGNHLSHAAPAPIAAGILLMLVTIAIAGWRWHRLLHVAGIEIPLGSLICVAQIGQFFTMFLPGPTGDDLTRMLYISRLAPGHVGGACSTVLVDRLIGLASVMALALCCIPCRWHLLAGSQQTFWLAKAMLAAGGAVCAAGVVFFLCSQVGARRVIETLLRIIPGHRLHDELVQTAESLFAGKGAVATVIGAAVGTQLILCVVYWLAGIAVGIHAPASMWFSFVPVVIAANAFPVTVAGIGVREYLLVLFLGVLAQIEREAALSASILVLGMTLAVGLLGGLAYIIYRPKRCMAEAC